MARPEAKVADRVANLAATTLGNRHADLGQGFGFDASCDAQHIERSVDLAPELGAFRVHGQLLESTASGREVARHIGRPPLGLDVVADIDAGYLLADVFERTARYQRQHRTGQGDRGIGQRSIASFRQKLAPLLGLDLGITKRPGRLDDLLAVGSLELVFRVVDLFAIAL